MVEIIGNPKRANYSVEVRILPLQHQDKEPFRLMERFFYADALLIPSLTSAPGSFPRYFCRRRPPFSLRPSASGRFYAFPSPFCTFPEKNRHFTNSSVFPGTRSISFATNFKKNKIPHAETKHKKRPFLLLPAVALQASWSNKASAQTSNTATLTVTLQAFAKADAGPG